MANNEGAVDFDHKCLQFDRANVRIQLTERQEEDLIIPSQLLKGSRFFNHIFEGRWESEVQVVHDEDGSEVKIFLWGLKRIMKSSIDFGYCLLYGMPILGVALAAGVSS